MRIWGLILVLLVALTLSGCRVTGEVENQAYVLVLGVDRVNGGELYLTARVPQIGKGSGDSEESGGSYLTFSASGVDWPRALEALEQATPRPVNLSHIEMLVVSEDLAREADFAALLNRIAETPHLYTTARFVVCEGSARVFLQELDTVIGTRLSSEIDAMLEHYAQRGYIPRASLADACFAFNSIYGDGVAILGTVAEDTRAAVSLTDPGELSDEASPMKQRYGGAALFSEGRMVGTLGADRVMLLNLLRGEKSDLPFECEGRHYTLTPKGGAGKQVTHDNEQTTLVVNQRFTTLDDICDEDKERLEAEIEQKLVEVIQACKSLSSDPFGFAEAAAARFATVRDWLNFDWREHYKTADIRVNVDVG